MTRIGGWVIVRSPERIVLAGRFVRLEPLEERHRRKGMHNITERARFDDRDIPRCPVRRATFILVGSAHLFSQRQAIGESLRQPGGDDFILRGPDIVFEPA